MQKSIKRRFTISSVFFISKIILFLCYKKTIFYQKFFDLKIFLYIKKCFDLDLFPYIKTIEFLISKDRSVDIMKSNS